MKTIIEGSFAHKVVDHLFYCGEIMLWALFPNVVSGRGRFIPPSFLCPHRFSSRQKLSISATLSRLQRSGIVARFGSKKKSVWKIDSKLKEGGSGLAIILKTSGSLFELPPIDGKIRLITFDIPEKERKKRNWLRAQLVACGFKPLHKSVWLGRRPLPATFIHDIKDRHLNRYVYILGVGECGMLDGKE